jgi:hypothetical protein
MTAAPPYTAKEITAAKREELAKRLEVIQARDAILGQIRLAQALARNQGKSRR